MSRKARALSSSPDDTSVSKPRAAPGAAERWRDLFGCDAPHAAGFIEQAIAWREQVLAHGDVASAIARDLAIVARQESEARSGVPHSEPSGDTSRPEAECPGPEAPGDTSQPEAFRLRSSEAECLRSGAQGTAPRSRSRAAPAPLPPASSQLLPGTRLVKAYGGRNHVVEVTATGFVYDGAVFTSLSAIAKHITGTHWNGLLFFGLRRRKTYPARAAAHG